jgi:transposase InsO family protein
MQTPTHGGAKYFVIFINDYSPFTIVYFICQKLDVFATFQAYKTFVENQIDKKIKMFHFDNGGEFTSRAFNAFCELHEITIYKFLFPTTKWNFQTKK